MDPILIDSLQVGGEYPIDTGPVYTETLLGLTTNWKVSAFGQTIIEPCNALSAFFFVLIVGYWGYTLFKHKTRFQEQPFMVIGLPILLIGGIGGTLFHGLRLYRVFLVMDWMPIMLLCLGASVYFFTKVLKRWWYGLAIILAAFFASGFLFRFLFLEWQLLSRTATISMNYTMMGLLILLPVFLWLRKTQFKHGYLIGLALGSFLLAVTFRTVDSFQPPALFFFGTHWLWHTFGALACHLMLAYLWRTDGEHIGGKTATPRFAAE